MIDFLRDNRELAAAIASVIVAILGVITALLKRNTSHTIRHETVVNVPTAPGTGRVRGASADIMPGISVAGDYLCVGNDSLHRTHIVNVTLGRGINGVIALLAAPAFGILALGAWSSGDRSRGMILGAVAFVGVVMASMKNVYVVTPQGARRIAKSLFPGEANRLRTEILSWRSG
jgi:hypothetical protein